MPLIGFSYQCKAIVGAGVERRLWRVFECSSYLKDLKGDYAYSTCTYVWICRSVGIGVRKTHFPSTPHLPVSPSRYSYCSKIYNKKKRAHQYAERTKVADFRVYAFVLTGKKRKQNVHHVGPLPRTPMLSMVPLFTHGRVKNAASADGFDLLAAKKIAFDLWPPFATTFPFCLLWISLCTDLERQQWTFVNVYVLRPQWGHYFLWPGLLRRFYRCWAPNVFPSADELNPPFVAYHCFSLPLRYIRPQIYIYLEDASVEAGRLAQHSLYWSPSLEGTQTRWAHRRSKKPTGQCSLAVSDPTRLLLCRQRHDISFILFQLYLRLCSYRSPSTPFSFLTSF